MEKCIDANGKPMVTERVSIIVPMLDEAANVAPLIEETRQAMQSWCDYEIIIVDDGSTDGTADEVRALLASVPNLRLARHPVRLGQSTAVRTGVLQARYEWIAVMDGDLQNDPADISTLWQARLDRRDQPAIGMLIGDRQTRHDSLVRRLSSRIANAVRNSILHDGIPDSGCGLKIFRRELYAELPYFDHMHRFMGALAQQAGWQVLSVPVRHRPRRRGQSKYGIGNRLMVGIVDLLGVAWLGRRNKLSVMRYPRNVDART